MTGKWLQRVIITGLIILCIAGTIQAQMQELLTVCWDEETDIRIQW